MSLALEDPDRALLAEMTAPPSLEQARSSLAYWSERRATLPVYRRHARREADEMIRRCRERVAAAERMRYGTGLMALVRRLLAGDLPSRYLVRVGLTTLVWAFVPRRLVLLVTAAAVAWLVAGILVLAAFAQLLA